LQPKYNMKSLRYILLLLILGLYATPLISRLSIQEDTSPQSEGASCVSFILDDLLDDYAKRLQLQYDWTDAITAYQFTTRSQENRLRSRRHERVSTTWQLRTHTQQSHAVLRHQALSISHIINHLVAVSWTTPLSLPTEQISFPFHSFW
jgi:hypothetical protein